MKVRKTFLTLATAGFMALLLWLPGSVFAGSGPNPCANPEVCYILDTHKAKGHSPDAFILAGWVPTAAGSRTGNLEVFVWVGGRFYSGVWDEAHPESEFLGAIEADIVFNDDDVNSWELPESIATELYGKPAGTKVVVFKNKDISDFYVDENADEYYENYGGADRLTAFKHMLMANVKLTFLVPK